VLHTFYKILPISIFLIIIGGIYSYQKTLRLSNDDVDAVEGVYEKMDLRQDKVYPLRLHLEEYQDVFVLDENTYRAWLKHDFLETVNKGSKLKLTIKSTDAFLLRNNSPNFIRIITIDSRNKTYLSLSDYNLYQKGGLMKLYLAASVLFILYYIIRFFQNRVIKT